jgi:hypothetical protein
MTTTSVLLGAGAFVAGWVVVGFLLGVIIGRFMRGPR